MATSTERVALSSWDKLAPLQVRTRRVQVRVRLRPDGNRSEHQTKQNVRDLSHPPRLPVLQTRENESKVEYLKRQLAILGCLRSRPHHLGTIVADVSNFGIRRIDLHLVGLVGPKLFVNLYGPRPFRSDGITLTRAQTICTAHAKLVGTMSERLHPEAAAEELKAAENTGEPAPEDFYFEGPYIVFTSAYLLKRGFCCNCDCRHCPYK